MQPTIEAINFDFENRPMIDGYYIFHLNQAPIPPQQPEEQSSEGGAPQSNQDE